MDMQQQIATSPAKGVVALNMSNADQLLTSDEPVLLDFWAPWCAPCRALEPLLNGIGERFSGDVSVVKVNVDLQNEIARQFNVRSIPTLVLLKNQNEVLRLAAAECSHEHIVSELARHL